MLLRANAEIRRYKILYRLPGSPVPQTLILDAHSEEGARLLAPAGAQILELKEIPKTQRKEGPSKWTEMKK